MRLLDRTAYAVRSWWLGPLKKVESLTLVFSQMILVETQAEWVLSTPSVGSICDEPSPATTNAVAPPTPPPSPPFAALPLPDTATPALTKSQRKARGRKAKKHSASLAGSDDDACCAAPECAHLSVAAQLARMRAYLVQPAALPTSVRAATWRAFMSGVFRHVVLRSAALAPLALATATRTGGDSAPESVDAFLDMLERRTDERGGHEVRRLWRGLKFARSADDKEEEGYLGVGVLYECLADVFRTGDELNGQHVRLLGGKVFKEPSSADLPAEGWDLFYQFVSTGDLPYRSPTLAIHHVESCSFTSKVSCAGCSYSVTRSFASWTRNRRLAVLGSYPAWLAPTESGPEQILRLARTLLCSTNAATCGRKVRRVESARPAALTSGRKPKRGPAPKAVLVEEWERAWAFVRVPLGHVWARAGVDLMASLPDTFAVLARNGETGEVVHTPLAPGRSASCRTSCTCCASESVWLSRVRSGLTPLERRTAPWTTSTFFPLDSVLDSLASSSSPERRFGRAFGGALDVLVVDNRPYADGGDWDGFLGAVGEAFVRARGYKEPHSLLQDERREALEVGEMALPGLRREAWAAADGSGRERVVYAKMAGGLDPRVMFREVM